MEDEGVIALTRTYYCYITIIISNKTGLIFYSQHVVVGLVRIMERVCHCMKRTATSVSAKRDSPDGTAKPVRSHHVPLVSFSQVAPRII